MFGEALRDLLDPRLRGGGGRLGNPPRPAVAAQARSQPVTPVSRTWSDPEDANQPTPIAPTTSAATSSAACLRDAGVRVSLGCASTLACGTLWWNGG